MVSMLMVSSLFCVSFPFSSLETDVVTRLDKFELAAAFDEHSIVEAKLASFEIYNALFEVSAIALYINWLHVDCLILPGVTCTGVVWAHQTSH